MFDNYINPMAQRFLKYLNYANHRSTNFPVDQEEMLRIIYNIDKNKVVQNRQVYNWMGLFSDVGGLCGTLAWLVSLLAVPYGEYSYILK